MKASLKTLWISLLIIGAVAASTPEEQSKRAFDEEALAAYLEDSDFQYGANARQGDTWFGRALFWLTERFFEMLSTPGGQVFGRGFWYLLLATIAIGAVILILRMRYGKMLIGGSGNNRPASVVIQQEENVDYQSLLTQAQQSGELKLAARYLFLWTIQKMSDRGVIQWKKWKTSHDYAIEINREKRNDYLSLSRFFESSWFGGHEPSTEELDGFLKISKALVDA